MIFDNFPVYVKIAVNFIIAWSGTDSSRQDLEGGGVLYNLSGDLKMMKTPNLKLQLLTSRQRR